MCRLIINLYHKILFYNINVQITKKNVVKLWLIKSRKSICPVSRISNCAYDISNTYAYLNINANTTVQS